MDEGKTQGPGRKPDAPAMTTAAGNAGLSDADRQILELVDSADTHTWDASTPAAASGAAPSRHPRPGGDMGGDSDGFDGMPDGDWEPVFDAGDDGGAGADPHLEVCAGEPETDIGNGRRFLHRFRADVVHVANVGWYIYDGTRWAEDVGNNTQTRKLAHQASELIAAETFFIRPSEREQLAIDAGKDALRLLRTWPKPKDETPEQKSERMGLEESLRQGAEAEKAVASRKAARRRYGKTSGSSGKVDNMLREAEPYVSQLLRDMDREPLAINLSSGTMRFVSVEERFDEPPQFTRRVWTLDHGPHVREDMITKLVPVDYDPLATCPSFKAFLERVQPQADIRGFLKRYFGYALTALTAEQVFVFFYGEGRNGKSTLVDLIARIMGEYSTTVPFETLAGDDRRKGGEATPDLARVPGARLVRAAEPEQGMKFRESMIKSLTSGEPILIRRLHAEFNEVYPTFKLVISGNHKPDVRGADDGIWRRVLLVPWEVQIPVTEIDRQLPDKLWDERAGVLNWLLEGALEYLTHGLKIPDAVRAATDTYREESDPIGAFIEAECEVTGDENDTAGPGDLYARFETFCKSQGLNVWNASTFTRQLPMKAVKRGFRKAKTDGRTVYRGIRLKQAEAGSAWDAWPGA
jgi:putative DNA primase/helicase